jgi:hypothetical protein
LPQDFLVYSLSYTISILLLRLNPTSGVWAASSERGRAGQGSAGWRGCVWSVTKRKETLSDANVLSVHFAVCFTGQVRGMCERRRSDLREESFGSVLAQGHQVERSGCKHTGAGRAAANGRRGCLRSIAVYMRDGCALCERNNGNNTGHIGELSSIRLFSGIQIQN